MSPAERILRARIAALTRWALEDGAAGTATARDAFRETFRQRIRSEFPGLPEEEVEIRADRLRRAYYSRIALASARSRRSSKP